MATLRVTGCRVDTKSITISFSEKVDQSSTDSAGALNTGNYTVLAPSSGVTTAVQAWSPMFAVDDRTVGISAPSTVSFNPGDWVVVTVQPIKAADGSTMPNPETLSRQVPSEAARTTRDVEDAISYPILTEEIGYRSSPVGTSTGGGGGSYGGGGGGGSNLGQVAMRAVSDVLGWKPSSTDPKGFLGALTQSFNLTDVEGHVESTWVPRTYAVQTDLGGGITGAQASLYTRAKDALDQSLLLLNGLYPLDPEADPEYVKALREMARSQMTEIVKELGTVGLPSILRIDTYFEILLGQHPTRHFTNVQFDPDKISGTLGELRDNYGIYFRGNPFNNSVEDEQDITNFRVISDYMTSLLQSWIANREFFIVAPHQQAFFGTQLVLISRQLNVIAETVNEVRFTLDSVFIGPNERQTLLLEFRDRSLPPMFLEDMLVEIEKFVTDEGPRLLRDGGKISITNNVLPVVRTLQHLVQQAHDPENKKKVPDGFRTARVKRSLDDLQDQLRELARLTEQVEQQVPPAEGKLAISGISGSSSFDSYAELYTADISFFGSGFDPEAEVEVFSTMTAADVTVVFYSAERFDITFNPEVTPTILANGDHEVNVTNPDGESVTLRFTYNWDGNGGVTVAPKNGGNHGGGGGGPLISGAEIKPASAKRRTVLITGVEGGGTVASTATAAKSVVTVPAAAGQPVAAPETTTVAAAPAAVSTTVTSDDLAAVHNRIDDLQKSHETWFQRLEDKMSDLFESKSKKKSKDDE